MVAAQNGHSNVVDMLLQHGASVDMTDAMNSVSVFVISVYSL